MFTYLVESDVVFDVRRFLLRVGIVPKSFKISPVGVQMAEDKQTKLCR